MGDHSCSSHLVQDPILPRSQIGCMPRIGMHLPHKLTIHLSFFVYYLLLNMTRRASVSSSPSCCASSVVPATPLRHVIESEHEQDDNLADLSVSTKAAQDLHEVERLEQERDARFQEAERELMAVLEADGISEHVRKRQLTWLFDRFRYEYTQISTRFRESLRMQRRVMEKCLEMKNELVLSATKIKTTKQIQEEEMKNLLYYREECEHAWKATSICEARERDAMRIIDELKSEIEDLHGQVRTLLGMDPAHSVVAKAVDSLSPVRSPSKRVSAASPIKSKPFLATTVTETQPRPMPSFDDWKIMTRVWDPHSESSTGPKSPTPTRAALFSLERSQQLATCVSVPSLQPTAMERASTAVLTSPKRQHHPRATTSISGKRLPSVRPSHSSGTHPQRL